jgi:Zn finger protein HypA/HybF involved in hydrogenase expression
MIIDFKCAHCADEWIIDGDEGFFKPHELNNEDVICPSCQDELVRDM